MNKFKLIIAGGRDFKDYKLLKQKVENVLRGKNLDHVEVVSGKCPTGADYLGERWAKENGIPVTGFPANWELFGNAAGPRRNAEMAKYADGLIAFWDCKSRGTESMINFMRNAYKPFRVIQY